MGKMRMSALLVVVVLTSVMPLFARDGGRGGGGERRGGEMNRERGEGYNRGGEGNRNYHPHYNNNYNNYNRQGQGDWNAARRGFGAGYQYGSGDDDGTNVYIAPDYDDEQADEIYQEDLQNNEGQ